MTGVQTCALPICQGELYPYQNRCRGDYSTRDQTHKQRRQIEIFVGEEIAGLCIVRNKLARSDDLPVVGHALDDSFVVDRCVGGEEFHLRLAVAVEPHGRIPVERRSEVGNVGPAALFGFVGGGG